MGKRLAISVSVVILLLLVFATASCNINRLSSQNDDKSGTSNEAAPAESSSNTKRSYMEDKAEANFDWKKLLTKEDAMSILNIPLAPAEYKDTNNPLGQKIIVWSAKDEMKFDYVQLSLITTDGMKKELQDGGSSAKTQYDSEKKVLGKVENVSGIGDEAFWDGDTPLISGLHVRKGDYYFTVIVNSDGKDKQLELEKEQAVKILERLP